MNRQLGSRYRTAGIALGMLALVATVLTPAAPAAAGSYSVGTTTFVAIGDGTTTTSGTNPYPVSAHALGMGGAITDIDVEFPDLYHARPSDLSLLVVSPRGTAVLLKATSWCEHDVDYDRSHVAWRFSDQAANTFQGATCPSGWYRPTVSDAFAGYSLPAPAPPAPYATRLSAFNGENPNGTWQVFAQDGTRTAQGELGQGFKVWITTRPVGAIVGDSQGSGPASPYPIVHQVHGLDGTLANVEVILYGLSHTYPDDLDVLLVGPTGRKVMVMSDACGGTDLDEAVLEITSTVAVPMSDAGACGGGRGGIYSPTDWQSGESLPPPAPAGPYASSLRAFAGTNPNGSWLIYINDDFGGDSGYLFYSALDIRLRVDTTLTRQPAATTTSRGAVFAFRSDASPAVFDCRLDDQTWQRCSSPVIYRGLAVRRHVFRVRGVNSRGDFDTSPAVWSWQITS